MRNRKLVTLCCITPIFLGITGTGFGLWTFNNDVADREKKVSLQLEPAVKLTGFDVTLLDTSNMVLDDKSLYLSGLALEFLLDSEYIDGLLDDASYSAIPSGTTLYLEYTLSCYIRKDDYSTGLGQYIYLVDAMQRDNHISVPDPDNDTTSTGKKANDVTLGRDLTNTVEITEDGGTKTHTYKQPVITLQKEVTYTYSVVDGVNKADQIKFYCYPLFRYEGKPDSFEGFKAMLEAVEESTFYFDIELLLMDDGSFSNL